MELQRLRKFALSGLMALSVVGLQAKNAKLGELANDTRGDFILSFEGDNEKSNDAARMAYTKFFDDEGGDKKEKSEAKKNRQHNRRAEKKQEQHNAEEGKRALASARKVPSQIRFTKKQFRISRIQRIKAKNIFHMFNGRGV